VHSAWEPVDDQRKRQLLYRLKCECVRMTFVCLDDVRERGERGLARTVAEEDAGETNKQKIRKIRKNRKIED
jgi:hypothetical protein